jgi:chemotaxis protein histidine kinase CheA/CheY-like chemotaxis protein
MQGDQQQRILGYFIDEAKDHLNTLEHGLLSLQSTINDPEMMAELFRAAHSVKGGAAMLGLTSIQQASHRLEDHFKVLKENPIQVDRDMESLFLRAFDTLVELLDHLQSSFGLTDEIGDRILREAEPTFQALKERLDLAMGVSGCPENPTLLHHPVPQVTVATGRDTHDPASAFQREVPQQLRAMLDLFKQSDTLDRRQQLYQICQNLRVLGETYGVANWCELLDAAKQATIDPSNSYRDLAPVLIRDIKAAQDLVVQGRGAAIAVGQDLRSLLPQTDFDDLDLSAELDDELSSLMQMDGEGGDRAIGLGGIEVGSDSDGDDSMNLDDLFSDASSVPTGIDDLEDFSLSLADTRPPSVRGEITNGPEIGAGELKDLADLFESEMSDLEQSLISEASESGIFDTPSEMDATEGDNDWSDLLFFDGDDEPFQGGNHPAEHEVGPLDFDDLDSIDDLVDRAAIAAAASPAEAASGQGDRAIAAKAPAAPDEEDLTFEDAFEDLLNLGSETTTPTPSDLDTGVEDLLAGADGLEQGLSLQEFEAALPGDPATMDSFFEAFESMTVSPGAEAPDDRAIAGLDLENLEADLDLEAGDALAIAAPDGADPAATDDLEALLAAADLAAEDIEDLGNWDTGTTTVPPDTTSGPTPDGASDGADDRSRGNQAIAALEAFQNNPAEGFPTEDLGDFSDFLGSDDDGPGADLDLDLELDLARSTPASPADSPLDGNGSDDLDDLSDGLDAGLGADFDLDEFSAGTLDLDLASDGGLSFEESSFEDSASPFETPDLDDDNSLDLSALVGEEEDATGDAALQELLADSGPSSSTPSSIILDETDELNALWGSDDDGEDLGADGDDFSEAEFGGAAFDKEDFSEAGLSDWLGDDRGEEFPETEDDGLDPFLAAGDELDDLLESPSQASLVEKLDDILKTSDLDASNLVDLNGASVQQRDDDDDLDAALADGLADLFNDDLATPTGAPLEGPAIAGNLDGNLDFDTDGVMDLSGFPDDLPGAAGAIDWGQGGNLDSVLQDLGGDFSADDLSASLDADFSGDLSPDLAAELGIDFASELDLVGPDASSPEEDGGPLFDGLDDLLDDALAEAGTEAFDSSGFSGLEELLMGTEADDGLGERSTGIGGGRSTSSLGTDTKLFAELEDFLDNSSDELDFGVEDGVPPVDPAAPVSFASAIAAPNADTTAAPIARKSRRDQTIKVPVRNLDSLNNLVGEMVVNRNSLEQSQERLRTSLDSLMLRVQQLGDVGQRMQDLYERSLLELSLLSSRRGGGAPSHGTGIGFPALGDDDTSAGTRMGLGELELDRFTPFHTQSQEIIELIVRVRESASDIDFVVEEADQLVRNLRQVTTQIQEGLTKSRMVSFAVTADRLPRAVRQVSSEYGKEVDLVIEGKDTMIDNLLSQQLYDPITHLVNNAIVHGIEPPEQRAAANKAPTGTLTIRAFYQGNQTVISISDDGAGIDIDRVKQKAVEKGVITAAQAAKMTRQEVYDLLFQPGFSTKDKADQFGGRGVGMDVVRRNIQELRGTIATDSTLGKGTTFTIRLPQNLSICKALRCISEHAMIAFPMDGVEDMIDTTREAIQDGRDGNKVFPWRDRMLSFHPLPELLKYNRHIGRSNVYGGTSDDDTVAVVVLRSAGEYIAIEVEQVLGDQEIVIKQTEGPVSKPVGIAGMTVLGDGRVMPIADVLELIDLAKGRIRRDASGGQWERDSDIVRTQPEEKHEPLVLIVDDSITVRELLKMTFLKSGYQVDQARDGQEAWEKLRSGLPCDLVFCDIEMPRMDGLEFLSRLQKEESLSHLPVAMLTSRGADRHRQMAVQLGARGYFTKPYLEEALLDAAQRMLKGEVLVTSSGA